MKQITSIITICLVAFLVSANSVSPVFASGVEQEQETKATSKVECTTGSYGQNVNCVAEATASAKQKVIVRADGTEIKAHTPTAAGLDAQTMAVVATTFLTGAAGVALKASLRA